jgi:hypothetical protein
MAIGACLDVGVMGSYIYAIWPQEYEVELHDPLISLIWLVPLVVAAVALKWHLVGGISIVLATTAFFFCFVLRPPYEASIVAMWLFPWAMVFLEGGIVNILAWGRERRR